MISAEAQWSAVLANAGVTPPGEADDASLGRVLTAVAGVASETLSDAGLLLALRLASTSGAVHDRVAEVDDWYHERRKSVRLAGGAITAATVYPPRSIAVAVLSFVFAVVGPVLAFPSVRTSSDYFLALEPAAVGSGALALVSAMWFLTVEIARIPFAGTRTRLYGPVAFVIPLGLVATAIATTLIRVNAEGIYGLTPLGLALQFAAAGVYGAAAVHAVRNRAEIVNSLEVSAESVKEDDLDHELRGRMDVALARAPRSDYDRAAAVEGVRELVELGDVSSQRAESMLRSLLN